MGMSKKRRNYQPRIVGGKLAHKLPPKSQH
jgi:hypothetical protein